MGLWTFHTIYYSNFFHLCLCHILLRVYLQPAEADISQTALRLQSPKLSSLILILFKKLQCLRCSLISECDHVTRSNHNIKFISLLTEKLE